MLKENREQTECATAADVSMHDFKSSNICAACCQYIEDRFYLLAVDRQWHLACLRCHQCKLALHTQLTCYFRQGNIYCKEDYYKLFGIKRCSRCQNGISSRELIMKARDDVYHIHCFTCALCGIRLIKGDHFGIRDSLIYCRPHYESLKHQDYFGPVELEPLSPSIFWNNNYRNSLTVKGRPRKSKPDYITDEVMTESKMMKIPPLLVASPPGLTPLTVDNSSMCVEMLHSSDLSSSMESLAYDSSSTTSPNSIHPNTQVHLQQRTKRMRTSFKHHQLRTMKSYFNVNQNPDAKDLKQLAQKTGLSKRVLQVWFQNARAKWRRNLMRQESQTNTNCIKIMSSLPLTNTSTTRSASNSTVNSLISEAGAINMNEFGQNSQQANSEQPLHFEELY